MVAHRCHVCERASCPVPATLGECVACWGEGTALIDAAAHTEPRGVRRWYREAGIVGYSRLRDITTAEVAQFADLAPNTPAPALDDPTVERVRALLNLVHEDGDLLFAHVIDGRSLRALARDHGIPYSTIRRRVTAALAAVDHRLVLGERGTRRHPFPDSLPSDDAA